MTVDMDAEIVMVSQDILSKLVKAPSQLKAGTTSVVSDKQRELIMSLMKKAELTVDGLAGIISRKFSKHSLDEITSTEASTLIETLQAM